MRFVMKAATSRNLFTNFQENEIFFNAQTGKILAWHNHNKSMFHFIVWKIVRHVSDMSCRCILSVDNAVNKLSIYYT